MAAIFQPFYPPAVPDSCSGRYNDDVSALTSSSLLGSDFFPDDSAAFGGLTSLLQDACSYPPASSCGFAPATDIPDLGNLLWDTEPAGSLSSDDFIYSPNECITFGQSVESPLANSSPVSPDSLSFPSSLAPSPLPAYSTPSPADFNLSPALSPASSFVEYSSPHSFSASPVESPPAPKRSRPSPAKKTPRAARKERKKEQNKTAAIRYRQKKKGEADMLLQRQQELERKNKRLHRQADSMMAEISYLKKLWQDVCSAKKRQQMKQ